MNNLNLYGGDCRSFRKKWNISEENMSKMLGWKSRTPLRKMEEESKLDETQTLKLIRIISKYEKWNLQEMDSHDIEEYFEELRNGYDLSLSDQILESEDDFSSFDGISDNFAPAALKPTPPIGYKNQGRENQVNYNPNMQTEKLANRFLEKSLNENERENKQLRAEKEHLREKLVQEQLDKTRLELRLDALSDKMSELNSKLALNESELKRRDDKIEGLLEKLTSLETSYNEGLSDNTMELKQQENSQKMLETITPLLVEGMKFFSQRQQFTQSPNGIYASQSQFYPPQQSIPVQQQRHNFITDEELDRDPE